MAILGRTETLRLADYPAESHWDAWRTALDETHLPWSADPRCPTDEFDAALAWRQAGEMSVVSCRCAPCAGQRTSAELRRTEADSVVLLLVLEGAEAVRQGEVSARLGAGDLLLWDGARPIAFELLAPLRKVSLVLPKRRLASLLPRLPRPAPLLLPGNLPEAALLRSYLATLAQVMPQQAEAAWQRSAGILPELLAAAVQAERPPAGSRAEALRLAVEAEVRLNVRDPASRPPCWRDARESPRATCTSSSRSGRTV